MSDRLFGARSIGLICVGLLMACLILMVAHLLITSQEEGTQMELDPSTALPEHRRVETEQKTINYNARAISQILSRPVKYPFRFVFVGDNEWAGNVRWRGLLEQIKQLDPPPLFIALVGDFAAPENTDIPPLLDENYRLLDRAPRYGPHLELIESLDIPVISIVGNHDLDAADGEDLYHRHFGEYNFYFDYGNTRFLAMYSAHKFPSHGIAGPRYEDMEFLDHTLRIKGPSNKILMFHIPPYMGGRYEYMDPSQLHSFRMQEEGSFRTFREIVEGSGVRLVCCAHNLHYDNFRRKGIHYVVSGGGGWDSADAWEGLTDNPPTQGYFYHFTLVSVNEDGSMRVQVVKLGDGPNPDPRYDSEIAVQ